MDVVPGRPQILVVDDDPMIVNLFKECLEMDGYSVICAYDGHAALRSARHAAFDLIVLDVHMPMYNGVKVLQGLRALPATAKVPVIFVTGELSKDIYPMIEADPRTAHLKKPVDLESLNSLVRHFLERYPVH